MARGCSGTVIIRITRKGEPEPVYNAAVVAGEGNQKQTLLTDADGRAEFSFPTPPVGLSLTPGSGVRPYSLCDISVTVPASGEITIKGCQVFPYVTSYINLILPEDKGKKALVIPPNSMWAVNNTERSGLIHGSMNKNPADIPEFITVHCGRAAETAENVKVSFPEYIANAASGMLYPTWPDHALRANMLAIITKARNIIGSGIYSGKGYDIATEPDGSMNYFKGRMIFEPIGRLAGELAGLHISKKVTDSGIKQNSPALPQWGSLMMASKGKTDTEIIKYYLGDDTYVEERGFRPAVSVFSGNYDKETASVEEIMELQKCLNRISICYPSIPIIMNIDGTFNNSTAIAVKAYRKQFGLPETGGFDRNLLRSINYVCGMLKKYSGCCGCRKKRKVLVEGDRNSDVVRLQHYLNGLSRRYGIRKIPPVTVNGCFDDRTRESITAFQRMNNLTLSGVADNATWDLLEKECGEFADRSCEKKEYPGMPVALGSRGENVIYIQNVLNAVQRMISGSASLPVDGIFDEKTCRALKDYQTLTGLDPDGAADESTWNSLSEEYINTGVTAEG